MATQMSNFGLIFAQVSGSAPGADANAAQLYASSSTNEAGTTQLFMKDSAGNEVPLGGSFKLEDGDGTELAISGGAQLKFVEGNGGVDINWTDTDNGGDGDEYDLTFTLDLNGVGAAAVDVANDSIAIIDADDSNGTKKESVADLVSAVAGTVTTTGLAASSGVLKLDIQNMTPATAVADADLVVIDDGAGGTLRKMTRAHFIESAALDAINIDGGAIDGAAIGANDPSTIVGTNITVNTALLPDSSGGADIGSASAEFGDVYIADDKGVIFGSDQDVKLEYDEDGTDSLLISGGDVTLADDKKLYFGTGKDASIEYDEDGDDELKFAGAAVAFDQAVSFDANVTLGNASSDTVTVTAQVASDVVPSTDNARDLGSSSKQWKDLYINGAAHIDALGQSLDAGDYNISNLNALTASAIQVEVLDVVQINSVTQSDVTLEVADKLIVSALSASSANSSGGGLKIGGGSTISGHASMLWDHANSALDFNIGGTTEMRLADGVLRPETDNDVDLGASGAEFKDLYLDGVAYVDTLNADALGANLDHANFNSTNVDIDSGAIDGTVIGANSAAAGTFAAIIGTSAVVNGNAAVSGTLHATGVSQLQGAVEAESSLRVVGVSTFAGEMTSSAGMLIADDKKLFFGSGKDASFEYDEDGTDTLLYAGASMRFSDDVKLEFGAGGDASFEYDEDGNDVLLYAGANMRFGDDIKLEFGAGGDASFEYDEDGNDVLLYAGASMRFSDDVKLEFGAAGDASIEYDEDGTDQLRIAAPAAGVVIAGTTPTLVIGDAGAEDTKLVFDGNAQDFYMGLDDSADKLLIGLGSTVGTTPNLTLESASRDVTVHGDLTVAGDSIKHSGGNAIITLAANGQAVGAGYGAGGSSFGTDGSLSAGSNITAGADGSGANIIAYGGAANERMMYDAGNHVINFRDSSGATMLNLGGDATTEYALDVANGSDNINKVRAAAFVTYSDESLKSDVKSMNTALDTVMSLEGVEFTWKDSGERDFGFIAQDVQSVLPKAVHTADDGVQGVDYSRLTSVLVEAVKAQQVQIEDLKKVISNLKK
jgi:hypothetical protein